MRYTVTLLIFFCFANQSYSQNSVPLFKIIAWSHGVTIGGTVPVVGMDVTDSDLKIEIPVKGYLGVIMASGEVVKVASSMNSGSVASTPKASPSGNIHRVPDEFSIYPNPSHPNSRVISDTLFFVWESYRPVEDTVSILIKNRFDDSLVTIKKVKRLVAISLKKYGLDKEPALIMYIGSRTSQRNSSPLLVTRYKPERIQEIKFDINRLTSGKDRLYFESAVYLFEDAYYDSFRVLLKILKQNQLTTDPILSAYYNLQFKLNHLDSIPLD